MSSDEYSGTLGLGLGLYFLLWQQTQPLPLHVTVPRCHHLRKLQLCQKDSQNKQAMLIQASSTKHKEDLKAKLEDMEESDTPGFLELLKDFAKESLVRILHQLELVSCHFEW